MLVSHRKRFIYTKTLKTAGTSVELYFEPYCLPEGTWEFSHDREECVSEAGIVGCRNAKTETTLWFNHMPARRIKRLLGDAIWNDYFKFCVVRNPFDKLVSAFHFLEWRWQQEGRFPRCRRLTVSESELVAAIQGKSLEERFRIWIACGGGVDDRNKYLIGGQLCVDEVIRHERLLADLQRVCDRLDIPFLPDHLPWLKSGLRPRDRSLSSYYDAKTIALVEQRYALELDLFGYAPPS